MIALEITAEEVQAIAPSVSLEQVIAVLPGVIAKAIIAAPKLADVEPDSNEAVAAKLTIAGAVARIVGAASRGPETLGLNTQAAGPFSVGYQTVVGTLSDKELRELKNLFPAKAFALDTAPPVIRAPNPWPTSGKEWTVPIETIS